MRCSINYVKKIKAYCICSVGSLRKEKSIDAAATYKDSNGNLLTGTAFKKKRKLNVLDQLLVQLIVVQHTHR